MIDKEWNNTDKIVIPSTKLQIDAKEKEELLLNLKKITPEEIGNVWDEIYYSWMIRKLIKWCDDNNLDLDLALYLIDKWHVFLLMKNIEKFDKKIYKDIVLKIIKAIISWNYSDKDADDSVEQVVTTFTNVLWDIFYSKEFAIHLIENDAESFVIDNIDKFREFDSEVLEKLVWKWCDLHELEDLKCFAEKDRKDAALQIIKSWWEPNLSSISKEYLTQKFALEIFNIGTEHAYKFLSKNIKPFDETTQKELAFKYIKGGYWKYVDSNRTNLIYCNETAIALIEEWIHFDITKFTWLDICVVNKLKENWYNLKNLKLDDFIEKDRKDIALEIIKAWWKPDLSLIPKEYLTQEFALEIFNVGTEHAYKFLAENRKLFDVSTQKALALKYIDVWYWTYVDAMRSPEVINCKEIAISLIEKWQEDELKFRFNCLDADVIHKLKEKKYDFKKLNKGLECFVEKDRKDAALQIIKSWWEPDLCFIPKWDLTKEFASEIINTKQDSWLKALSLAIPFFKASLIDDIVLNLVNAGWWKYVKNEVLKTDHFDNCLNKWFILALLRTVGTTEAWTVLKKFSDLDSEVASIFVKLEELGILAANLESFNNLNSEIAKSLIDWWYKSAVKKNIERFILDDKTINLLNNWKGKSNSQPKTGKLKKLFSSLIGSREEHEAVSDETIKILQELPNFHKEWKDHRDLATDDIREKIIDAADKIPVDIDIDSDWNKIFILKLKNRTLQILIPRLENYTDEKYADEITFDYEYCSAFDFNNKLHKSYIKLWWMDCDDISKRKNKKLAKYVNEKENEWYYIPSKKDMIDILSELWESAWLNIDDERKNAEYRETPILTTMQMLLLMYLIGCPGSYRLSDFEESSDNQQERLIMILSRFYACFEKMGSCARGAGILMIK